MNDLNRIRQSNAAAVERSIPKLLEAGRYVVTEYAGVSFVDFHFFEGPDARALAEQRLAELNSRGDSTKGWLLEPIVHHVGEVRAAGDIDPIFLNGGGSGCVAPSLGKTHAINNDHLAQRLSVAA